MLPQFVKRELPNVQTRFRKGRGTRDQMANIHRIIEEAREFKKTSISALLTMPKPLCRSQQTGRFLEMEIQDHLTCLLRNLYAGQEATVRTGHGTIDYVKSLSKEYVKDIYCHPAYLTYMQSTS